MDLIQKNVVKNEMWIRARDTRQPMRAIFDEVRDLHPNVAIAFDDKLQRSMQRARRVNQPAVPQSIDEAEESLNNNPHYKTKDGNSPFYHGRVSTGTGTALIFICLGILPILRSSEEIACDATFATLPFLFAQLFTIHVDAYTYMFPLAYAIMTEKTEALYNLVFARAIYKKVTTEGLKRAYAERPNVQKVIKMLIALALLPADQAHAGFLHIQRESIALLQEESPEIRARIQIIFEYMQAYWFNVVTPERFCVHGQSRRTTNEVESFHRWFNARCEYLQKVESSNLKDFNLARAGQAIKRQQSFAQKTKDRRILQYADALRAGELTVYHFLEVCAQFFEPAVLPIVPAEEPPHADHSDDDEIDPPVRGRGGRARRLRVRRNGNGRAARQAPIVPGQRMPRNRRAGRGGGAVGGGPGRERDVVNPNHAALDPELILQQAMVEVGLPIDVANNQPLIEEPPLLDMDCEICGVAGNRRTQTKLKSGQELKIRALWEDAVMCAALLLQ
ncbi:hypothetical protein DAPPUDRAFT_117443 [Daphnia pulex]|uniref:MULE transposase domain-containing protein n=1 Tax=Daphnia pulex TaxID=6669 RepID=E9HSN8_DAPPU|nr:hypothetical protein DAPPUDRAFT_117443 [Daphnia pulex]|eukprot:EFX65226.1 hypothetical protein DAPPUDRAFT_117443 [Daphnia pulex]